MKIVNFNNGHIEEAMKLAGMNYEEEKSKVAILPEIISVPDLSHFAENGLGVAAFDQHKMIGFFCAYLPREDAFGTTGVRGTFSPVHAHGAIHENRGKIYSLLYQEASKKWVQEGIVSHAIALYKHDMDSINSFFYNGFGLRCIDAIRDMKDIDYGASFVAGEKFEYCEVPREEWGELTDMHNDLITHLSHAPIFMSHPLTDEEDIKKSPEDIRYFAAKAEGRYIAYVRICNEGECFITSDISMRNICGAYCLPQYRGKGIYQSLLSFLIKLLKKEGITRLGVDCESFNPNARGFWLKYFTEYTHSVVRRIDEKIIISKERQSN